VTPLGASAFLLYVRHLLRVAIALQMTIIKGKHILFDFDHSLIPVRTIMKLATVNAEWLQNIGTSALYVSAIFIAEQL